MADTAKVRALNDAFRTTLRGGQVVTTQGVMALDDIGAIVMGVREFSAFTDNNDPYGEHDFGSFTQGDQLIFWKIDCYDADLVMGSLDPADPAVTTRVLTIMLAEEY